MLEAPRTPGIKDGLMSPTTPRTKAFNTLSGKGKSKGKGKAKDSATPPPPMPQSPRQGNQGIPLRHHISMGDEVYQPGTAQ